MQPFSLLHLYHPFVNPEFAGIQAEHRDPMFQFQHARHVSVNQL